VEPAAAAMVLHTIAGTTTTAAPATADALLVCSRPHPYPDKGGCSCQVVWLHATPGGAVVCDPLGRRHVSVEQHIAIAVNLWSKTRNVQASECVGSNNQGSCMSGGWVPTEMHLTQGTNSHIISRSDVLLLSTSPLTHVPACCGCHVDPPPPSHSLWPPPPLRKGGGG
jgi:hypothetical protein